MVRYELIKTPQSLKDRGYLGDYAILDKEDNCVFAASPANFIFVMNGGPTSNVKVGLK